MLESLVGTPYHVPFLCCNDIFFSVGVRPAMNLDDNLRGHFTSYVLIVCWLKQKHGSIANVCL